MINSNDDGKPRMCHQSKYQNQVIKEKEQTFEFWRLLLCLCKKRRFSSFIWDCRTGRPTSKCQFHLTNKTSRTLAGLKSLGLGTRLHHSVSKEFEATIEKITFKGQGLLQGPTRIVLHIKHEFKRGELQSHCTILCFCWIFKKVQILMNDRPKPDLSVVSQSGIGTRLREKVSSTCW